MKKRFGQSIFAGHTLKQKYNAMQRIVFNTSPQTEYCLQISVLSHASKWKLCPYTEVHILTTHIYYAYQRYPVAISNNPT